MRLSKVASHTPGFSSKGSACFQGGNHGRQLGSLGHASVPSRFQEMMRLPETEGSEARG